MIRLAVAAAVPVAGTTTFRSRFSRVTAGCFLVSLGVVTASCRRTPKSEASAPSAVAPVRPVEAPPGLLARGVLQNPAAAWRVVRPALGGRARLLPITPELAVTTLADMSPLVAGLVMTSAPAPFVMLDTGGLRPELVAAFRTTSAAEFVVAVSNGADAKFVAERDAARSVTVLRPKGAARDVAAAVAGDYLVLARDVEPLRVASAYAAAAPQPNVQADEIAEVAADRSSIDGPARALVARIGEAARRRLEISDSENRARHGGRAPDFADPKPFVAALSAMTVKLDAILASTARLRAAAVVAPAPSLRVELSPMDNGAARDLARELPRGDLSLLAGLPSWTSGAFLWHRRESTGAALAGLIQSVFGERIVRDRRRVEDWANDLDRGLGRSAVIGFYGDGSAAGAFALAAGGDGSALRRAASKLADLARVPALRDPAEAFLGRLNCRTREGSLPGLTVTRVSIEVTDRGTSTPAKYAVAAASNEHLGAIVLGSGDVDARLLDLLEDRGRTSLGADRALRAAAQRVRSTAACGAAVRVRAGARGEDDIVVISAGADDDAIWFDAEGSLPAFLVLLSLAMDFPAPP